MMNQVAQYSDSIPGFFHSHSFSIIVDTITLWNAPLSETEEGVLVDLQEVLQEIQQGLQESDAKRLDEYLHPTRIKNVFWESRLGESFFYRELFGYENPFG